MAKTDTPEVLLGRYHAREVTLSQLQRRRIEAGEKLAAARKELKKITAEAPAEDAEKVEFDEWYAKVGKTKLSLDKLAAEKAAAEQALNMHIGSKALPLFAAEPEAVAADCISGGITLLLEQGLDAEQVKEQIGHELFVALHRFALDQKCDEGDEKRVQAELFDEPLPRDETERSLAWLLGTSIPRPEGFAWIEIVAHLSDDDLAAAWAWAICPHKVEQPGRIAAIVAGDVEGFEHDPELPCEITATAEATLRLGLKAAEIDETGRVTVFPTSGPPQEVGRIQPSQQLVGVFAGSRLIAAADPRWRSVTRDDWTWVGRGDGGVRLPPRRRPSANDAAAPAAPPAPEGKKPNGQNSLADIPAEKLREALTRAEGNQTEAAEQLGITRDSLRRRLIFHGIRAEDFRGKGGDK